MSKKKSDMFSDASSTDHLYSKQQPHETFMGSDTMERMRNLGRDSLDFRKAAGLKTTDIDTQIKIEKLMRDTGGDILGLLLTDEKVQEMEETEHRRKTTTLARILRKKVSVIALEDSALSITVDQEWDTSAWSDEMVIQGCDALTLIFFDPSGSATENRKNRAVFLLQKLVGRHRSAEDFIRRNIEIMIGKAANRMIRRGKSAGLLDLLYVLHGCRERFSADLSRFNFTGRAHEMMLLEARLAAILIQNAYRVRKERKKGVDANLNKYYDGFGDPKELDQLRIDVLRKRSLDLRQMWRLMHCQQIRAERNIIGGFRGPVHVPEKYLRLALEIILELTSENAGANAAGNREDVVRANGCIILAGFLASPEGPFANLAVQILSNISKAAECISAMIHAGVVKACFKYVTSVRSKLFAVKNKVWLNKATEAYKNANELRHYFIDAIFMVTKLGIHASGIFRARSKYHYKKEPRPDSEAVDYLKILNIYGDKLKPGDMRSLLSLPKLIQLIAASILENDQITLMRYLLRCFYSLSTSECYNNITVEICLYGGRLLKKLIDLLEDPDIVVSTLAMCILIQVSTQSSGRSALLVTNIPKILHSFTKSSENYSRKPYLRAMFITATICRTKDWRAYDPQDVPVELADDEKLRVSIYLDVLKTMKNVALEKADKLTIADLVVLPIDYTAATEMSVIAESINPRDICDFFGHPQNPSFFESLPLDESCGCCVALEGLTLHPGSAASMMTVGTIYFLGQMLFQSRFLFLGKPMGEKQTIMVLCGVASTANALANFCDGVVGRKVLIDSVIEGVEKGQCLSSACFYINALTVQHPDLDEGVKRLQVHAGMSCIRFFDCFSKMILSLNTWDPSDPSLLKLGLNSWIDPAKKVDTRVVDLLDLLKDAGKTVGYLIQTLKEVHGHTRRMVGMLENMCALLEKLTKPKLFADLCANDWDVFKSLRAHKPTPLSSIVKSIDDNDYVFGLDMLPPSFFDLCANLCQVERGCSMSLADGIVRFALEKLMLLQNNLEGEDTLKEWALLAKRNLSLPEPSANRKMATSCLNLLAQVANSSHRQYGSANDVIFLPDFNIIEWCCRVIGEQNCPRSEKLYVTCIEFLVAISKDDTRCFYHFEAVDMIRVLEKQLNRLHDHPAINLRQLIVVANNFALGYHAPYFVEKARYLREPLFKISRFYPILQSAVQDVNWSLSKNTLGKEVVGTEEEMSTMERYILTGQIPKDLLDKSMNMNNYYNGSNNNTSSYQEEKDIASNKDKKSAYDDDGNFTGDMIDRTKVLPAHTMDCVIMDNDWTGRPKLDIREDDLRDIQESITNSAETMGTNFGTYMSCGISTCGSLKCGQVHHHGQFGGTNYSDLKAAVRAVPNFDKNGVCELSGLQSSKKEQIKIEKLKIQRGISGPVTASGLNNNNNNNNSSSNNINNRMSINTEFNNNGEYATATLEKSLSLPAINGAKSPAAGMLPQSAKLKQLLLNSEKGRSSSGNMKQDKGKLSQTYSSKAATLMSPADSPVRTILLEDIPELRFTKPSTYLVFSDK